MFEVLSIKQEPELDIVSDNEGDPQSHLRSHHEDSDTYEITILDNSNVNQNVNENLDCKNVQEFLKSESPINIINERTNGDKAKVRSFQCYMCSKSYTAKQMLKLHIHSIHMLLKPFQCKLCSRSFADKYTLTTHSRIHSGERPYVCPTCSKTFVQHSALTKHKRTHTKEKPFKCEYCLKAFSDRSSLIPHRKIHTGESLWNRSFKCEICNASFIKNSHLVRHTKTKSHIKELTKCKDAPSIKLEVTNKNNS